MTSQSTYCWLLALPGELRNRIYHFVIEDEAIVLSRQPDTIPKVASTFNTTSDKRALFKLAHVSRQLRRETLPLYRAHSKMTVRHQDVDSFHQTFLASLDKVAGEAGIEITVAIEPQNCLSEVDLMPVVNMLAQTPVDGIRFVDFGFQDALKITGKLEDANRIGLAACINNSKFREYIAEATQKFMTKQHQLWLYVKPEYVEPWMLEWNDGAEDCADEDEAMPLLQGSRWIDQVGLSKDLVFAHVWFGIDENPS